MNKFLAIIALVVVACAATASARLILGEQAHWHCGAVGGEAVKRVSDVEPVWSNSNDKVCKKTCSGTYPVYKKGNWALFTDGLSCCCSVRHLLGGGAYDKTSPHISHQMARNLGISGSGSPSD